MADKVFFYKTTKEDKKPSLVPLSKGLSWLLRHNAEKEKIQLYPGGFADVDTILRHRRFKEYSVDHVKEVVETNDKQRFTLRIDESRNVLQIRANQGHSVEVEGLELDQITDSANYPTVIHGTTFKAWKLIKTGGLCRMRRNHIHFAPGTPGDKEVISGIRVSSEVHIYINLLKALEDGIKFFRSQNNVILTAGNESGILESKYFSKAVNVKTGALLTYS